MQVSSNIVRFPYATATAAAQRLPSRDQDEDNVIAFAQIADMPAAGTQEHGQLFAAQRIAGRVADELDHVAVL